MVESCPQGELASPSASIFSIGDLPSRSATSTAATVAAAIRTRHIRKRIARRIETGYPNIKIQRLESQRNANARPVQTNLKVAIPIYEFECEQCGGRFEELVGVEAPAPACGACGSTRTRRLLSNVSPPGRQPRGAGVRSDESRRREREASRQDRITESRKRRAAGEKP